MEGCRFQNESSSSTLKHCAKVSILAANKSDANEVYSEFCGETFRFGLKCRKKSGNNVESVNFSCQGK